MNQNSFEPNPNPPRVGEAVGFTEACFTGRLHHAYTFQKQYDMSTPDPFKDLQRSVAGAFSVQWRMHWNRSIRDQRDCSRAPPVGDRSVVFTVMNQVTNCIVRYEDGCSNPESAWHCLSIPCPVTILNAANTAHLHAAYTSYLVAGALGIGNSLNRLGLSTSISDALGKAKWVAQVMIGDALETNSSTFHMERVLLGFARKSERPCNKLAIRLKVWEPSAVSDKETLRTVS